MPTLSSYISSHYVQAANRLAGKHARKSIVAYVESFDDVAFWSTLLRPLETEQFYFEVMLPSKTSLCKGKKIALANQLGPNMIACVDADYDYLMQGASPTSKEVCHSPYVFHTLVYAIENYHCHAGSLHNVCVSATLNDRRIFDFEGFMQMFSEIIHPLFVWNVWCYREGKFKQFSMADFYRIVRLRDINLYHPEQELNDLRRRVNSKIARLQHQFPEAKKSYKPLKAELIELGVTPETTYLFMRGHDLLDGVVSVLTSKVCDLLRKERERDIHKYAEHAKQMQNELASYQHSVASVDDILKRHNGYITAPQYLWVQEQLKKFLATHQSQTSQDIEASDSPE
jgi:hypothetical protein